ncbi:hypothetical protein [Bradyrhizobium japonicum]|uniref:hypothetical protein n=1 Tax=Bradyrhizobium japonicum TaxID=375 RepID=UPI001BAAFCFD|nr:hypothetical protein [Bradyrhizobium japonicum]MBR0960405.1 hypothetical protein [Bradyrhizobium japonicum]
MNFIDLKRYFIPVKEDQEPSLDVGRMWGPRISGWMSWDDLRQRRRVILLAEAYSGKTEEFRHQCEVLQAEGKPAFFLRIEDLDQGTEQALDGASTRLFRDWLAEPNEAWFFLDSVDEARLNRKNFDSALRRFAKEIGDASERAHVYVSCRVTDWRGAEDRATFLRYLAAWKKPETKPSSTSDYSGLLAPLFEKADRPQRSVPDTESANLDDLTVVQLSPLSTEQYGDLAKAAGVQDVRAFTEAIAKQGLAALTERPGDLVDLADYWNTHGKFGAFEKMLEHSIFRKLSEPNPHRPDNEAISHDDAVKGAERIAAALTLGKSFTLRAPGSEPDPKLAAGALDPAHILPDWTDAKRNALLRRGIFAPATYGRIRFHHRSTQEYLTAKWLDRLIKSGCPQTEVFNLLFAERYGVKTIVPSLRSEAAWLSLWHTEIRDEVIRREPLALLGYGDPGSLPLGVREQILLAYATRQASGDTADDLLENRDLWLFADKRLAPAILKAWSINKREDFHFDLLRLIREGAIVGAVSLARSVAKDKKANDHHRIVAVQGLEACGDNASLAAIAKALTKKPEAASTRLASSLSLALYPALLKTSELLRIIAKAKPPKAYSTDGFGYHLQDLYDKAPDNTARKAFLSGLADLCLSKPFKDDFCRVARQHQDIAKHLHDVTRVEVLRLQNSKPPDYLVRLLMVVERSGREGFNSGETPRLFELVRTNPALNRALMWADIAEQRANGKHGPVTHPWQVFHGGSGHLWALSSNDLPWLGEDLRSQPDLQDRQVALSGILALHHQAGQLAAEEPQIRSMIGSEAVLLAELTAALTPAPEDPMMRSHRLQSAFYDLRNRYERIKEKEGWVNFRRTVLDNPELLRDPKNLSSWKKGIYRLHNLYSWLQRRTRSEEANVILQWRLLVEGFDRQVAEAFRDGMKQLWRIVKPVRPIKKPGGVITIKWPSVLAFAGVGIEAADDPDWASSLSPREAALAARHACRAEQHYPEWLDLLTIAWPKAVVPIIREQVELEWSSSANSPNLFLHRYGGAASSIQRPVQLLLIEIIASSEANSISTLNNAQRIVRRLDLDASQRGQLFKVFRQRFHLHLKTKKNDFALSYLGLLLLLAPDAAMPFLEKWLNSAPPEERKSRAELTFSNLFDRYDSLIAGSLSVATIKTLEALLHLAYSRIRPKDDIIHEGSYSPDTRDHAQHARDALLSALLARPGPDAYGAIRRLSDDPVFALRSHRFRELARGKAIRDSESPAWTAEEVRTFETGFLAPAKTGADLLRIVLGVLAEIDHSLTKDDFSSRALLEKAKDEDEVQPWLAEQLLLRAKGRFHLVREGEIALGDKPDIFVASTASPFQVALEIKHGGKGWSGSDLENALHTQLAEDYLKPEYRRHGVLVVTHHRDRRWQRRDDNKKISFADLIRWLSRLAEKVTENTSGHIQVECVGINAWKAKSVPPTPKRTRPKAKVQVKRPSTNKNAAKKKKEAEALPRKQRARAAVGV